MERTVRTTIDAQYGDVVDVLVPSPGISNDTGIIIWEGGKMGLPSDARGKFMSVWLSQGQTIRLIAALSAALASREG